MADETMTDEVFMAHMKRAVRRSQEIWPDDWRNHHTFYDGEVARLLDTLRQADEPRAIVRAFAAAMERKLAANDGKDSWKSWNRFDLLVLLNHEVIELQDAINDMLHDEMAGRPTRTDDVLSECVDVSNFAMMIADVCGALPPTDERGR